MNILKPIAYYYDDVVVFDGGYYSDDPFVIAVTKQMYFGHLEEMPDLHEMKRISTQKAVRSITFYYAAENSELDYLIRRFKLPVFKIYDETYVVDKEGNIHAYTFNDFFKKIEPEGEVRVYSHPRGPLSHEFMDMFCDFGDNDSILVRDEWYKPKLPGPYHNHEPYPLFFENYERFSQIDDRISWLVYDSGFFPETAAMIIYNDLKGRIPESHNNYEIYLELIKGKRLDELNRLLREYLYLADDIKYSVVLTRFI